MNIPDFTHTKIANEDGTPTDEHRRFMEQLTQTLRATLSQEGTRLPQQTTDIIVNKLSKPVSTGRMLYNKDTHQVMVNINGTFKTVQVV